MKTEAVYFKSGKFGNFAIRIDGLDRLMRFLKTANPELQRAMKRGLKEAVSNPILPDAQRRANAIADDGTYAASLSVSSRANGSTLVLKSTDEAAGVKEFAHIGAKYIVKSGDKRANARKMGVFPAGVPRRAYAPRVMVPAVNENIDAVKARIDRELEKVLGRVDG